MAREPVTRFTTYTGSDLRTAVKVVGGEPYVDLMITGATGLARVIELNAADIGMICQRLDDARDAAMAALLHEARAAVARALGRAAVAKATGQ